MTGVALDWKTEFVEALRKDFNNRKKNKSSVTLRGYALRLGLSAGTLSDLMKRKKSLSSLRAQEILKKIQMDSNDRNRLILKMGGTPQHEVVHLSEKDYDLLTDWEISAVLFSSDLAKPYRQADKIADMTGIPLKKVKDIISRLEKGKFLVVDEEGFIQRPEHYLTSTDNIPSEVAKKGHVENLNLSMRSLLEHSTEQRDITSLTFAGSKEHIALLRKEIRKLYAKASVLMNQDTDPDTVYRMSIQLFPLEFKK